MASRNQLNQETEEQQDVDDGILSVLSDLTSPKEEKILAIDADSPVYWTLFEKNEDGSRKELTEEDMPFLEGKLNEIIIKIFNSVEKYFIIKHAFLFIRGKDNFRKNLYPLYKSNRPERHILTNALYSCLETNFGAKTCDGFEAEDFCYSLALQLKDKCIVAYVDHDLEDIAGGTILYNYQKNYWKKQTDAEGLHNKYSKLIIGEAMDFANFTPKIGKSYFNKNFKLGMSEEEYEQKTKECFLKCWKTEEKAEEMLKLAKEIIWLKDINNLTSFNNNLEMSN